MLDGWDGSLGHCLEKQGWCLFACPRLLLQILLVKALGEVIAQQPPLCVLPNCCLLS